MNELTEFEKQVLVMVRKIPSGRVSTYAEIAKAISRPGAVRAVGNALNKNPDAPIVPCHRVVKSNGEIGGYARGIEKKIKLLNKEGVAINNNQVIDFSDIIFKFKR